MGLFASCTTWSIKNVKLLTMVCLTQSIWEPLFALTPPHCGHILTVESTEMGKKKSLNNTSSGSFRPCRFRWKPRWVAGGAPRTASSSTAPMSTLGLHLLSRTRSDPPAQVLKTQLYSTFCKSQAFFCIALKLRWSILDGKVLKSIRNCNIALCGLNLLVTVYPLINCLIHIFYFL